jgi:SAM-dependent methyltransferase
MTSSERLYLKICDYYTEKILKHGPTPAGVDWLSSCQQEIRFDQLTKICPKSPGFSVNDLGCGYGALLEYFRKCRLDAPIDYLGIDISPAMIREARRTAGSHSPSTFVVGLKSPRKADYSIASGIFNGKFGCTRPRWEREIRKVMESLRETSIIGFAVNFKDRRLNPGHLGLYTTLPEKWIGVCEGDLGCSIEVLSDYGLEEFTLLAKCSRASSLTIAGP